MMRHLQLLTRQRPRVIVAELVVLAAVVLAVIGGWLAPYDPEQPTIDVLAGPSRTHLLGTDASGIDVLSVVVAAFRVDVLIAVVSIGISLIAGVALGAFSGYSFNRSRSAGIASTTILRALDLVQSVPVFILALALVGMAGQSVRNVVIAVAFVNLPVFFVAGWLVYRGLVRRVMTSLPLASLLMLFALWLVLQNLALAIWGADDQSIITVYTYKALSVFGFRIPVTRLLVFGVALLVLGILHYVLGHTYVGKALRATVQDPQASLLVGIDTDRISAVAFGLGTAFAGFAGSLLTLLFSFTPDFGGAFQLKSFTIIVLGGLENFAGVTVGAAILAFVESFAVLFMKASLQNVIAYALLVIVLIVMPGGVAQLWSRNRS